MDRISDSSTSWLVRAARKVRIQLYFDRHDYRRTVLIAGTARSGTTWLQELLNFDDHYRSIFEPLHPRITAANGFRPLQYVRPTDLDPTYFEFLAAVLAGRIRHTWTDKFNRKIWVKQRLIKCIHANLLLKWIKVNFPEIPIILLVRHPCAVANSRLKLAYPAPLHHFLSQEPLVTDHLAPFAKLVGESSDLFDRHILAWCIEHYVPQQQFQKGDIELVFYERLVADPERELQHICAFIGRPYDPEMLGALRRPSALTKGHSPIVTGESLVEGWRKDIRPDQVKRAMDLIAAFGLDHLYSPDGWPLETRANRKSVALEAR